MGQGCNGAECSDYRSLSNSVEAWGRCNPLPLVDPGQSPDWGCGGETPGSPRAPAFCNIQKSGFSFEGDSLVFLMSSTWKMTSQIKLEIT